MKKHKWYNEIVAWASGAEIEMRATFTQGWNQIDNSDWNTELFVYRIKPQPKEPQYLYVYEDIGGINITSDKNYATKDMEYIGKIKLEVDDE